MFIIIFLLIISYNLHSFDLFGGLGERKNKSAKNALIQAQIRKENFEYYYLLHGGYAFQFLVKFNTTVTDAIEFFENKYPSFANKLYGLSYIDVNGKRIILSRVNDKNIYIKNLQIHDCILKLEFPGPNKSPEIQIPSVKTDFANFIRIKKNNTTFL